jgi:hypothetical protein
LDGRDWVILLCTQPQFSRKCDWSRLSDKDWEILFSRNPDFQCGYWNGQYSSDRSWKLRHNLIKANFSASTDDEKDEEKIKWSELDGQDWSWLLRERPGFSPRCKWGKLTGGDWSWLLREQPQFADKCDWRKLRECDWDFLLSKQPQFSSKYENWKQNRYRSIKDSRFVQTLTFHAEGRNIAFPTEEKYNGTDEVLEESSFGSKNTSEKDGLVNKFDGKDWSWALQKEPDLAKDCEWEKLTGEDWCNLLCAQPQFFEKCDWKKLNYFNWRNLLRERPEFERIKLLKEREAHDDLNGIALLHSLMRKQTWDMLNATMWGQLLANSPRYACHCNWEKFSAQDWFQFLCRCPQMWIRCDWDKMKQLNGRSWRILLIEFPQFAYYCNWESLSGDDWNELLIRWPRFFDRCNHEKLTGQDWTNILCNNPQFASYCDWKKLDKNDWEKLLSLQPQFHNAPHRKS